MLVSCDVGVLCMCTLGCKVRGHMCSTIHNVTVECGFWGGGTGI